ncbi:hypothetical protein Tco_0444633 [Tanacetum coccineum]
MIMDLSSRNLEKSSSTFEKPDVEYFPLLTLSCLLKEQLLEPALNLIVHCCGLEIRVLKGYDQKSFDEERGPN